MNLSPRGTRNDATTRNKMDPQQTAVYTKAHSDLQDLFREIARHGRVTAHELQHVLLPFTAGDAKRDLQALIEEMKSRQTSLDEADFIRVMWKKMYLNNVMYTAQHTGSMLRSRPASAGAVPCGNQSGADEQAVNIPIAHVIVSIKRRAQLKQFANYYASRGISGADHLKADKYDQDNRTPRHLLRAQKQRLAQAAAAAQAASTTALRDRKSATEGIVVCYYDSEAWTLRSHRLFDRLHDVHVSNCSRLHCFLSSTETGPVVLTSRYFRDVVRSQASRLAGGSGDQPQLRSLDEDGDDSNTDEQRQDTINAVHIPEPVCLSLSVTKLETLGLRNTVALGVGRGMVAVATQRRVHSWDAFATRKATAVAELASVSVPTKPPASPAAPRDFTEELVAYLEDEGDSFGHTPLLKRAKIVDDVAGLRQVACGDRFAIGVTASSELFVWGHHPLSRQKATPAKMALPSQPPGMDPVSVLRVACGLHHAVLLTSTGYLFSWGANVHGQLGLGAATSSCDPILLEPTQVLVPGVVLDVACGDHHTITLTDRGAVMAWGSNWHGQLGLDPETSETGCVATPTRVNWWLNLEEAITVDADSQRPSELSPKKSTPARKVYLISAIGATSAIVTDQGQVYTWGKCIPAGDHMSVCGIVDKWKPQRVTSLDRVLHGDEEHDARDASSDSVHTRDQAPRLPPWTRIAIASGMIVLSTIS